MEEKITNIKSVLLKNIDICSVFNLAKKQNLNLTLDKIAKKLNDNTKMIALNNIDLNDKDLLEISKKTMQLCAFYESFCLIFKRCDIAKLADLTGVILSNDDISHKDALKILENDKIFGYLTKNSDEINDQFDFLLTKNNISNEKNIKTITINEE